MSASARFAAAALLMFLLSSPFPMHAQDEQTVAAPSGTLMVEQKSEVDAVGKWTLLRPNHESFHRTDASLSVPDLAPGQYSFFAVPPDGTTAHIDIFLGDDAAYSSDTPQISFEIKDTMTLKLVVTYSLTIFGKIGVGSDPAGVPFEMVGPNGMLRQGVTPVEFSPVPIGNYSVTFKPDGCPRPPQQSGMLDQDGRINFMIKIICKNFRPVEQAAKPKSVTVEFGGKTMVFGDVHPEAWFAPYVTTIVSRGIMSGYLNADGGFSGRFGPGDPVTIAQLAKIAHTSMKINENEATAIPLNPLASGQWFAGYFASSEERGWSVYAGGTVDPNRPATRGEVVATLLQVLDIPVQWAGGDRFTDVLRKTRYAGEIETAAAEGIVSGSSDEDGKPTGLFHPTDPITRAEIAKILIIIREKYQASGGNDE